MQILQIQIQIQPTKVQFSFSIIFFKGNEYTYLAYIICFPEQTTNLDPNLFPEPLHNIPEGG